MAKNFVTPERLTLFWQQVKTKIPTKLSQLNNDGNFVADANYVHTDNNYTNSAKAKLDGIDLAKYYLKTETYNKTEVTALIGDLKTIQIEKVQALPQTGESNKIYIVSKGGSEENNIYKEYIWVAGDNKFELIGDTRVDLSGYWAKSDLVECTESEILAIFA